MFQDIFRHSRWLKTAKCISLQQLSEILKFLRWLKTARGHFLQSQNILLPNRFVDNSGRQVAKAIFWHLSNFWPTQIAKAFFWHLWCGNYFHMVGEPVSACRGNRSAGCGGTARPGYLNAYLIQKVRTPSGKPGWGIIPAWPQPKRGPILPKKLKTICKNWKTGKSRNLT